MPRFTSPQPNTRRCGQYRLQPERHLEFVAQAAEQQVQLLVFPELSLSGYGAG